MFRDDDRTKTLQKMIDEYSEKTTNYRRLKNAGAVKLLAEKIQSFISESGTPGNDTDGLINQFYKLKKSHDDEKYNDSLLVAEQAIKMTIQKYEDALTLCKTTRSIEDCKLADEMQEKSYNFVISMHKRQSSGRPQLINRKEFRKLADKYHKLFQEHIEINQRENIALCSENLKAKNPKISHETVTSLCETVNGILKTPDTRDIPENFESHLHKWFRHTAIIEEIYKTINSKDLCFLHEIEYHFEEDMFVIPKHLDRDNEIRENLDFKKYFDDQIKPCESKLMAIELAYKSPKYAHATMIVIEKHKPGDDRKQLIEVEHFDSSNIEGERIRKPIEDLIKSLFVGENFIFKFHHQDEICNINIQGINFRDEKHNYRGSCSQFSVWYAFKRLLEPHKTRKQVVAEKNNLFEGKDSYEVMINLIKTFQTLLSIKTSENDDSEWLEVNERPVRFEIKKPKKTETVFIRPAGNVASLIAKYESMSKKNGGKNTKRKKRRGRKPKSAKKRV